jgi:hypothetical protein
VAKPRKVEQPEEKAAETPAIVDEPPRATFDSTHYSHPRQRLSAEKLSGMSASEIRAVAEDRGYRIGLGGRRVLANRFLSFQQNDLSGLHEPGELDQAEPLPVAEQLLDTLPEAPPPA